MKIDIDPTLLPKKMGKVVALEADATIGEALRLLRLGAGMSQAEMAAVVERERTSWTNMEKGNQVVALGHLERLAIFLGAELHISFRRPAGD